MKRRIKTSLKYGKKTLFIIEVDNIKWGILNKKVLHLFSKETEWLASEEELKQITEQIKKNAWQKVLRFLAYRERSTKEVIQYLNKMPLKAEFSNEIIRRIKKYNYLNDDRFGEVLIRSLISKNKSKSEIKYKLLQKGISSEEVDKMIGKYLDNDRMSSILLYQFQKSERKYSKYTEKKRKEKCYQYLM